MFAQAFLQILRVANVASPASLGTNHIHGIHGYLRSPTPEPTIRLGGLTADRSTTELLRNRELGGGI